MQNSFKYILIFVTVVSIPLTFFSQKSLLVKLDTLFISQNKYLAELDSNRSIPTYLGAQLIEPGDLNAELLAACIYEEINNWRDKKRREKYREHSKLDRIAFSYVGYHKWYKFKNQPTSNARLNRFTYRVPKFVPLDFTYIDGFVNLEPLVDYRRGEIYYNDELESSPVDLYFGRFSKEENFEEKPVEQISYRDFAKRYLDKIIKMSSVKYLRSKGYELLSVRVAPIKKKTNKKLLPKVKVICLLGAYRNKYVLEEFEGSN